MIRNKYWIIILLAVLILPVNGCKDLDKLNVNPNGVDPTIADLNLLMPTVLVATGQRVVDLGIGDIAGVMQHTQLDGWTGGHNEYDWNILSHSWSAYYDILRNNDEYYNKALEGDYLFHQGVALVMKAYAFGMIADLWGDAPYTEALKAEEGDEHFKPVFDGQRDIYLGILEDLKTANTLLSLDRGEYEGIIPSQDVLYRGDPSKWRRFANSLALRYYMRLSEKEPGIAENGIREIVSNPGEFPIIVIHTDDANIGYIGTSAPVSWPTSMEFNPDPSGAYMRRKMCSTLVEAMQENNDPRLSVWANKVEIPLVLVTGEEIDRIVELPDGSEQREVSQDIVDKYESAFGLPVNFDPEYVGIPPAISSALAYNMTPDLDQGVFNPHCSHLSDMYMESAHELLQMRLLSASEVHFILAETALRGWIATTPEEHYEAGIRQSLNAWGVGSDFEEYLDGVPYNGLESIIRQKWIASWTAATESWFDWRRTGFPELQVGEAAVRDALPLRFYYHADNEIAKNQANAEAAIARLEPTPYKGSDVSNNSAWSKIWVLQGTGKPY